MEGKNVPESIKMKLTVSGGTDSVDSTDSTEGELKAADSAGVDAEGVHHDVVRPFVPGNDSLFQPVKNNATVRSVKPQPAGGKIRLGNKHFNRVSRLCTVLSMVLAISLGGVMWNQRQIDEERLSYYNDQAELAESNDHQHPDKAINLLKEALSLSESLHANRRSLADLHMRIAAFEANAGAQGKFRLFSSELAKKADATILIEKYNAKAKDDLLASLRIYKLIPNTRSEQIAVLNRLINLLTSQMPNGQEANIYCDPYAVQWGSLSFAVSPTQQEKDINEIVSKFKKVLVQGENPSVIQVRLPALFKLLHTPQQYTKVIALLDEYVYHARSSSQFLEGHRWLDAVIERSGRSVNAKGRLDLGNQAFEHGNLHAAIVEYSRYLGTNDTDQQVRNKLLRVRRLNHQHNIGSGIDPAVECTAVLKELRSLTAQAYGADSPQTRQITIQVARNLSLAEDPESAEKELAPLLAKAAKIASSRATPDPNSADYDSSWCHIFTTQSDIATQRAMYKAAARDLKLAVRATGESRKEALRNYGEQYANLLTSQGLYFVAERQIASNSKAY